MYFDKFKIRHRALLEAIRFCGGVAAYSDLIKVSRTRASNWCNQPEIRIPYEYALLTENVTRVSIERLSPFTESANKIIRSLRIADKLPPIDVPLDEIIVGNYPYYKSPDQNRPIIIGTDRVLISGLTQMEYQKSLKMRRVVVMVLDLESLLLGVRSIKDLNFNFLMSEQVAIGLRLERLICSPQGKYDPLHRCLGNGLNNIQACRICDTVKENSCCKVAQIMGFTSKDAYHLARQVYLSGIPELIDKLDKDQVLP